MLEIGLRELLCPSLAIADHRGTAGGGVISPTYLCYSYSRRSLLQSRHSRLGWRSRQAACTHRRCRSTQRLSSTAAPMTTDFAIFDDFDSLGNGGCLPLRPAA